MKNSNLEEIMKILSEALNKEEDEYTFFNKDIFQKKFKNLLAFTCILGSIIDKYDDIIIKEVDYEYVYEKYLYYISDKSVITDDEKEKVILFASTVGKVRPPDSLITKWNEVFGDNAFFNISIEPKYRTGLHAILRERVFNAYMNNLFRKSKRYKIWKLLNI